MTAKTDKKKKEKKKSQFARCKLKVDEYQRAEESGESTTTKYIR